MVDEGGTLIKLPSGLGPRYRERRRGLSHLGDLVDVFVERFRNQLWKMLLETG